MTAIQDSITRLRAKGWTVGAVADALGVHRETVTQWISGRRRPTLAGPVLQALQRLERRRIPPRRRSKPSS